MPSRLTDQLGGHRSLRIDGIALCAAVIAGAAAVAGFAWTRPTTSALVVHYSQNGRLTYNTPTSPTSVYGSTGVKTGQPVYAKDVPSLNISYTYHLTAPSNARVSGTEQLIAKVSDGLGITRSVPLQAVPTQFSGAHFRVSASLSFASLDAAVASFQPIASVTTSTSTYKIDIYPQVAVHGRISGIKMGAAFNPVMTFSYVSDVLSPAMNGSSAITSSSASSNSASSFQKSTSGSVTHTRSLVNQLLGFSVEDVRIASLVVLAIAIGALLSLGWPLIHDFTSDDERVRIETRYKSSLVEIHSLPAPRSVVLVDISEFTGLSVISHKLECPILHLSDELGDIYAVVDNGTLYQYRVERARPERIGRLVSDRARHASLGPDSTLDRVGES